MTSRVEIFSPPPPGANTIMRQAVTEQIDSLSRRSVLFIHAPAGYGKTTIAALWSQDKDAVWLSLDEYSAEPEHIYKWLLLALSHGIPPEFENAPLECTLDALPEIDKWPEAIIIDDFHLCADDGAARALMAIRSRMPGSAALIILSRNPPPPVLDEQIMKGKIRQISALEFTRDEIASLFHKNNVPVSKREAELLCRQTDGWAAALSAMLMSNMERLPGVFDKAALNRCLKSYISGHAANFDILKKCSVCDTLKPELCAAVTEQAGAWEVITSFADQTGFASRLSDGICRFHALMREFLLSELQFDKNIDKPALYKLVANWYKDNGDLPRAIVMAAKSEDIPLMEEYLRLKKYEKRGSDIMAYVSAISENMYEKLPAHIVRQSLRFSIDYFLILFYMGRLRESFEWIDNAKNLLASRENARDDIIGAAFELSVDPRENVWDIPENFKNITPDLDAAQTGPKAAPVTLTFGFPFFHKAQVDYSDISRWLDEFVQRAERYMVPAMAVVFKTLILLLRAGVLYERGELTKAEMLAAEAVQMSEHLSPEIRFSSLILYTEILRIQDKEYEVINAGGMISETEAHYLSANFDAYTTNVRLQNGEADAAGEWLARVEIDGTLRFYKIYQYFVSARALIVSGKLADAEKLLIRLIEFSKDYRRSADVIEALTLLAICRWHMKRADEAVCTITPALQRAAELSLVMPVAKEGRDIMPVLQKVLNRLKYGYDADKLDRAFVNTLLLEAQDISGHTRGMFAGEKTKPPALSARQKEILVYLGQGLTYREISEKVGVTVFTVDDHIRKIYKKLEVSNARDAVYKARKLGL